MANSINHINIRVTSNFSAGLHNWACIGEVEFYNSSGVKLSTSGVTAGATEEYPGGGYGPAKCIDSSFDYNTGSYFNNNNLPINVWFDFATPLDIASIRIYNSNLDTSEHVSAVVVTATHAGGSTTSVSSTRPSGVANVYTSHTIPALAVSTTAIGQLPAVPIAEIPQCIITTHTIIISRLPFAPIAEAPQSIVNVYLPNGCGTNKVIHVTYNTKQLCANVCTHILQGRWYD